MKLIKSVLTISVSFVFASLCLAHEDGRRVEGGDSIYQQSATEEEEPVAVMVAHGRVLKAIESECHGLPKGIIFNRSRVDKVAEGYHAVMEGFVSLSDCNRMLRAPKYMYFHEIDKQANQDVQFYNAYLRFKTDPKHHFKEDIEKRFARLSEQHEFVRKKVDSHSKAIKDLQLDVQNLHHKPIKPYLVPVRVPAGDKATQSSQCVRDYNRLMQQAQMEAQNNYPHGNLAQGQAAVYFNQAQNTLLNCPELKRRRR